MRAVNLIPGDAQRSGSQALRLAPATYALLGGLVAALVLVTMFVLAHNNVASRQAQVSSLRAQLHAAQTEAAELTRYTQFASAAQARVSAVRQIAGTRFDWHAAFTNLAKVIPANTSLQSLSASVVPGASAGNGGGSTGLRAALPGPAFEMSGCTASQDDVARLISRLRVMTGVTRVSLANSSLGGAVTVQSTGGSSPEGSGQDCRTGSPTFNLVVFFTPVNGAGPNGAASAGSTPASTGGAK
jgi:Tfp pilus assembly protein PilN